jgi:hypothetical protein
MTCSRADLQETSRKWCYYHAISQVYRLIIAVLYPCGSFTVLFNSIGFLPMWVRNINLHHLVRSKWKIGERQAVLKRHYTNKPAWKSQRYVDVCCNVSLAHSSVRKIRDNADSIKASAKSGTKVFVCVARLRQSYPNELYQKPVNVSLLRFYCIVNKYLLLKLTCFSIWNK